mmetsp:Transcript_31113/g.47537  ORF Transcript_31113/g.47537 Transcript_31113/m.47537 type:complete len:98 (-) Transcript_31113:123-416(-)
MNISRSTERVFISEKESQPTSSSKISPPSGGTGEKESSQAKEGWVGDGSVISLGRVERFLHKNEPKPKVTVFVNDQQEEDWQFPDRRSSSSNSSPVV